MRESIILTSGIIAIIVAIVWTVYLVTSAKKGTLQTIKSCKIRIFLSLFYYKAINLSM